MRDDIDPRFEYAESLSGPVPEYLQEVERQTFLKTLAPQMMSGRLQGRLLAFVSKLVRPRWVLEIGTFTGYAALCLAEGLAEGGQVHTIEGHPETAGLAQRLISATPLASSITLHEGQARPLLPTLPHPWDLVFLDGDKRSYPHYLTYFADRLRPGALLLADNVLWDGRTHRREEDPDVAALRAFNHRLKAEQRFEQVVLPLRDGVTVARRVSMAVVVGVLLLGLVGCRAAGCGCPMY